MAYTALSDSVSAPAAKENWTMKSAAFYLALAVIAIVIGVPAAIATMLGAG